VAQSLKDSGHRVFFDKDSLPPAGDFNARIRKAIRYSDRFIFLASRSALESGRFTLTELEFVRQRWASPIGRVLPVIIDPELKPNMLPAYFSGVQVITISGNAPAEIVAAVERTGRVGALCWACLALLAMVASGTLGLATGFLPNPFPARAEIGMVAPDYVHFRPRARPPNDPSSPGADTGWIMSPATITLPTNYVGSNARSGQILKEEVELQIGERSYAYSATSIVRIRGTSVAESTCGNDWLCVEGNAGPVTVAPGAIVAREIMFIPDKPISWKELMDSVLAPDGPVSAKIILRAKIMIADAETPKQVECRVELASARKDMLKAGFKPGLDPRPPIWQPRCL